MTRLLTHQGRTRGVKVLDFWFQSVDLYCERTGPSLLAEPLNLITNASFFVAALFTSRRLRATYGTRAIPWVLKALIALMIATGLGSALFHSFATRWAMALDVAPIVLFATVCTVTLARSVGLSRPVVIACCGAFALLTALGYLVVPSGAASGSHGYFGALAMIWASAFVLSARRHLAARSLFLTAVAFTTALLFRGLDLPLCSRAPEGTHFLWHLANGFVLFWAAKAASIGLAAPVQSPGS